MFVPVRIRTALAGCTTMTGALTVAHEAFSPRRPDGQRRFV